MSKRLRLSPILLSVFITGAAVLAIEVAATRILAPSFGHTIFTVSSILSVVLGALSFGYYLGGRWADKNPSPRNFYLIIFASGLSVFGLQLLAGLFLPIIGALFSSISGPLVAAAVLFFLPSFLLGTLSPFAIALKHRADPKEGVGQVAGSVFFWSTAGSIAGSLATGFILVPRFGISAIMVGVGVVLCLLGMVGLKFFAKLNTRSIIGLAVALAFGLSTVFPAASPLHGSVIYAAEGIYGSIRVINKPIDGRAARLLAVEGSNSAASFVNSDDLAFNYTRYSRLMPMFRPDSKRALVIGGGGYSVPKQWLSDLPKATIDVAEIEPSLYDVSKQYLRLKDDPRLKNYIEDGRTILRGKANTYDVILGDAYYSVSSVPTHLTTKEFFETTKESLTTDGIFMMNLIGNLRPDKPSYTLSELRTFQSVFPNMQVIALRGSSYGPSQNLMIVGTKSDKPLDWNSLDDPLTQMAQEKQLALGPLKLNDYPIFTDDFAPVDYYFALSM